MLLESAKDDRADFRIEVAKLQRAATKAMWEIRRKWERQQDLSRAEWIFQQRKDFRWSALPPIVPMTSWTQVSLSQAQLGMQAAWVFGSKSQHPDQVRLFNGQRGKPANQVYANGVKIAVGRGIAEAGGYAEEIACPGVQMASPSAAKPILRLAHGVQIGLQESL